MLASIMLLCLKWVRKCLWKFRVFERWGEGGAFFFKEYSKSFLYTHSTIPNYESLFSKEPFVYWKWMHRECTYYVSEVKDEKRYATCWFPTDQYTFGIGEKKQQVVRSKTNDSNYFLAKLADQNLVKRNEIFLLWQKITVQDTSSTEEQSIW